MIYLFIEGTLYKRKTYKQNPKVSPFGIAVVKKCKIKLGDAGTIDRFGLAFQYQIKTIIKKRMDKCNCRLKILYNNTSAIWQHMLHIPTTKVPIS